MQKQVLLIDDHHMMRLGIKDFLKTHSSWSVEYECSSPAEVDSILAEIKKTDLTSKKIVAVVDLSFKDSESGENSNQGFDIVVKIRKAFPENLIPCIIYSTYETAGFIERALSPEIGAKSYITKTSSEKNLIAALEAVSSGKKYIQENLQTRLIEMKDIYNAFTKKEKEVITCISQGLNNSEIAEKMNISCRTVENYLSNLYDKTSTTNKIELMEFLGLREK